MIKIQSFSDIITNSSSEVFLVKTTTSKKDFAEVKEGRSYTGIIFYTED